MKRFICSIILTVIYFSTIEAQIPTQNLKLWLRSDSGVVHNNGAVEIWQDISGNGNHATQTNVLRRPNIIFNSINNKPAISFSNSFLDVNSSFSFQTVFIITNYTENQNFISYPGLLTRKTVVNGTTDFLYVGNPGTTNFYPSIISNNTRVNNILTNSFAPLANFKIISGFLNSSVVWNDLRIGDDRGLSRFWNGNILELLIYDSLFTNTERVLIENFLMDKYAPPINIIKDIEIINGVCKTILRISNDFKSILWSTGDTTNSIIALPNKTYIVSGVDIFGRTTTDTIFIGIENKIVPEKILCPGDSTNLNLNLIGNYSYSWPNNSTNSNIFVNQPGYYWVEAIDTTKCYLRYNFNVKFDSLKYQINLGPNISICKGENIGLISGNQNIINYLWSTNDTTSSIAIQNSGLYYVTVTNSNLCSASDSINVNLKGQKPSIGFISTNQCLGDITQFTDTSSAVFPDNINSRIWNIKNDTFYIANPSVQFNNSGFHNIQLTVVTDSGCVANINKAIKIYDLPNANFNLPDYAWKNDNISITNISTTTDSIIANNWTVYDSDNNIISSQNILNPTLVFTNAGTYNIKLETLTNKGCLNSKLKSIKIEDKPIPFNNLSLWLRADRGVEQFQNYVNLWRDQSTNNNHAVQSLSASRPTLKSNAINNFPSLVFDGVNDHLNLNLVVSGNNLTSFIIFKPNSTANDRGFLVLYNNNQNNDFDNQNSIIIAFAFNNKISTFRNWVEVPYTNTIFNNFSIYQLEANGSSIRTKFNNNASNQAASSGSFNINKAVIGSRYSSNAFNFFMNMEVAEIIIYDSLLTASQIITVENYLMDKYSPPVNLGSDINIDYGFCGIELKVGDNFTNIIWSNNATSNSINVNQSGTYWVSAIDIFGRFSSDTININFPNLNINNSTICLGSSININPGLSGNYTYLWSTLETTSNINISTHGNYWVEITDSLNCKIIKPFVVQVDSFTLNFDLGTDKSICQGDEIALAQGHNPNNTYLWSTGSTNQSIIPNTPGKYWLNATNINSCFATDSINITFHGYKPTIIFSTDSVCFGSASTLTDLSTATTPDIISSVQWIVYGDTLLGSHQNYTFSQPGNHNFNLTVQTQAGCKASSTGNVFVVPNPIAKFGPLNGCTDKNLQFSNFSLSNFGGISSWEWTKYDLNNNVSQVSPLTHPTFTFDSAGVYNVRLIATTTYNCRDTITQKINIRKTPDIDFSWSTSCVGLPVLFTEQTKLEPWESIIERKWWLGDGSISQSINPTNTYDTAGYFNVSLYNKSISGCSDTITKQIKVGAIPNVDFTYGVSCVNSFIQFTDQTLIPNDTIYNWLWTFNNNEIKQVQNPQVHFSNTGTYNVELEVTSVNFCKASKTSTFTVNLAPTANFSIYPEYGSAPLEVSFQNLSIGANQSFWNFGDGNTSTLTNPTHIFTNSQIFETVLITTNDHLCTDTIMKNIYVIPSYYDVSIEKVNMLDENEMLRISVDVKNLGTRKIRNLKFRVTIDNNIPFYEYWSGELNVGESMVYSFNLLINPKTITDANLICVMVEPNENVEDENEQNNSSCAALKNEFMIHSIAPNPAKDILNVRFLLANDSYVNISILSTSGKTLFNQNDVVGLRGLNNVSLNISNINQGVYILKISNDKDSAVKYFVKINE